MNKIKNFKLNCLRTSYPFKKPNNKGYPKMIMLNNRLRFKNKTALSYFSIKLINVNELITSEVTINNVLNMLKLLNNSKTENADIIRNNRPVITAK
ncbi:hypothetical protein BBH99_10300 [Chryseobacterium contaminans]|uniref:Uncharacterized protein n=1 Tax=Chryseobacterium contaminans TaxID=1423959 RepID=A0A1M6XDV2_9FLAO|nr:hypothetical protein BBH99_10300 [Chryseobacterium contaminans]SHL04083.1 hypothetical protein SAMN05444407_10235 [Chryseobacterium contaminans]